MSWGRTLNAVADQLPTGWASGVDVVQINGGMSVLDTSHSASWAVAVVADKAGGQARVLPAPAIVARTDTAHALREDPTVAAVMERARLADTLIFTAGAATLDSAHVRSGYLAADQITELRRAGAVGDIIGRFFDRDGYPVDPTLDGRTLGISLDDVARAPTRILVAATAEKSDVTYAALKRGLASCLVIDSDLAQAILAQTPREIAHV
jgi:deoxyribonucleoside regulator